MQILWEREKVSEFKVFIAFALYKRNVLLTHSLPLIAIFTETVWRQAPSYKRDCKNPR